MKMTVETYARKIADGEISPVIDYDGKKSGLLLDPKDANVPLSALGFGIWQLEQGPFTVDSKNEEYVLVPQECRFRFKFDGGQVFEGQRGDPFTNDARTNACALYVPSGSTVEISGEGECIFYKAPALSRKAPRFVAPGERSYVSRGLLSWRRDVVTLISPEESTNLVVGETYSPPGLWSGTPLHRHDGIRPEQGESDHEEVYYHIMRYRGGRTVTDEIGPYGVQLLFDGKHLNESYIVRNKSIVAIPGVCHPVVAAPVTDHIYGWGLGGHGEDLGMLDMPEFSYLKTIERTFKELAAQVTLHGGGIDERGMFVLEIPLASLRAISTKHGLDAFQEQQLKLMAREYGIRFIGSA